RRLLPSEVASVELATYLCQLSREIGRQIGLLVGRRGDIGTMFPDDEEQWQGADSIDLLRTAVGMIAGPIVNVDATVICEEPRLGPYKAEMERTLAAATSARVSVKATSNEGMGWIGRGEGIACIAVASVQSE
ncbi:MAG: 2C-methyl-D-erythritol 2,4-cyclodiphosphate synthase, partial [Solirubrobacterales bacterium]|nr:2C-methyl-D-erythritol 2,4-cyclodiphosphate synthase [Solirubrobacterales bacterium]